MTCDVLYIDSYYTGSHRRTADLFQRHSGYQVELLTHELDHWKWLASAAHFEFSKAIKSRTGQKPGALIISSLLNIPGLVSNLPESWRNIPRAVYFHESQWTYPTRDADVTHHLIGHLDALMLANRVWFNSNFHRSIFWQSALENRNPRIRKLADRVMPRDLTNTSIVHPPVHLERLQKHRPTRSAPVTIAWVARWESEKRPDIFVNAIERLSSLTSVRFNVLILGPGSGPDFDRDPNLRKISHLMSKHAATPERDAYERELREADIVVSTAEHEFFGIAILEACQAGALPVLPFALAYPETVPSAWFYRAGDTDDLARVLRSALEADEIQKAPWKSDASRFNLNHTVRQFDQACEALLAPGIPLLR